MAWKKNVDVTNKHQFILGNEVEIAITRKLNFLSSRICINFLSRQY